MELKDYKIIWLTEGFWNGTVKLDNSSVVPSMRNDVSTQYVLGVEHYPIFFELVEPCTVLTHLTRT